MQIDLRRVLAGLGVLVLVAACSGTSDEPDGPDPGASTSSAAATPAPVRLPDDVLLPPAEMPAWNGAVVWQAGASPATGTALDLCTLPTMAELGAVGENSRDYAWPEGDMDAVNLVGQFDSPAAAGEAAEEIADLFRVCTQDTQVGDSSWTTNSPGDGEQSRFEFVGVEAAGAFVTVVGFSLTGQDANFTEDPLAESLATSTALLDGPG